MKISASIYSDKSRSLKEVILDLVAHQVDLLHVDCNDDLSVFDDIENIRLWCNNPIDLHIITEKPSKYYDLLEKHPVEYVTFQVENLREPLEIPTAITGKKGLAIITPTPISAFDPYSDFDFILIMATIPGQSGGKFDRLNFSKIRQFRTKYPSKSIHVDGGVNGEVSFILRNMGVSSAVSGSYLFNGPSIGHALMNLTKREIESSFIMGDFMIPLEEAPAFDVSTCTTRSILEAVEYGQMGFALAIGEDNTLTGIVSSADIRKTFLKNLDQPTHIAASTFINRQPLCIQETATVIDLLQLLKKSNFPVMYLPVVNDQKQAVGIINFVNLIKGEL
ncbi:MAG: CBS domain-containing protein [Flavobacteriia bacterium]|jgi:pentose-5-phosphate-3-epimerase